MNFNKSYIKYFALGIIFIYILYLILVGMISSVTGNLYNPEQDTTRTDQQKAQIIAQGVNFAIENELNSTFGWLCNDLFFVPTIIDNKTAYQKGIIFATRPASDIIAKTVARIGQRDTIDPRLANATSRYFVYGEDIWGFEFIYDAEGKYYDGINSWNAWANSVGTNDKNAGIYNVKSDDVYNILKYCANMTDYALGLLNDTNMSHFKTDDTIYYAKGIAQVAGNVLRALNAVDDSVKQRGGAENLQEALYRFDLISQFNPLYTFAGGNAVGDAMMPNHVAALARHLDIANNRLNDMLKSMEK